MKRVLKILGLGLFLLLTGLVIFGLAVHERLPEGQSGENADMLANKMLDALNYRAYEATRYLEWSYRNGANSYKWNKELGVCTMKWREYEAVLNLVHPDKSKVIKDKSSLTPKETKELIAHAFKLFNNDSFWLVAPYKVFDKGTKREIVVLENGGQALLVTYSSGGTTPGDSYLWILNEHGFPEAFKMWVKIIPIGGVEASWDEWVVAETGAFLPKSHQLGPFTLSMGNVKGNK